MPMNSSVKYWICSYQSLIACSKTQRTSKVCYMLFDVCSFVQSQSYVVSCVAFIADLEGFTNILCHIVPRIEPPASAEAAERLAGALSSDPETKPERRLQGLINLYNTVLESAAKFQILLKTLEFAKASGLADIMLGVVKANIESWISVLSLSPTQARTLYLTCADSLKSCTRKPKSAAKEAYRLRLKALKTYTKEDSQDGVDVAAQVVSEYISSGDLFQFDLLDTPVVQNLKSSSHSKLYALLHLLLDGSVKEFRDFLSKDGASLIADVGTTEEALTSKMLLLALVGLMHGKSQVSFQDIASTLDIPNAEVENIIVKAIGKKLIEAKIDQLQEIVLISKCASRKFEQQEWKSLQHDLKSWREAINKVLALGTDPQTALTNGFAQLESYA
jgi:translation initiation factor 3 subunit M